MRRPAFRWPERQPRAAQGSTGLLGNAGALFGSRLIVAALGWAGTVLIVRTLSREQWGQFSFIFGLLGLLAVFTDLGVGRVAIAGLVDAENDRPRLAGTYIVLRSLLGLLGYVMAIGFVVLAGYPSRVVAGTAIAGLVLVIATPSYAFDAIFQTTMRLRTVAIGQTLGQVAQLALTAAIAVAGGGLVLFTIPAVLFEVVAILYKAAKVPPEFRPRFNIDWEHWRHLLREAGPLAVGGILASTFDRIDLVMLSKLDTFAVVGTYGIAYKFADVVHFASSALSVTALPLLVRAWPGDQRAFSQTFRRALVLACVVGGLVLAEFALFSKPVVTLLYGVRYSNAATATVLVVGAQVVHLFAAIAFVTLIATGRHRHYPLIAVVGVIVNVGLNLWMIPAWSFNGAAISTLITEVTITVLLAFAIRAVAGTRPLPLGAFARVALATAATLLSGLGLRAVLPWPVAGVGTAVAFTGLVHLLRPAGYGGLRALAKEDQAL